MSRRSDANLNKFNVLKAKSLQRYGDHESLERSLDRRVHCITRLTAAS